VVSIEGGTEVSDWVGEYAVSNSSFSAAIKRVRRGVGNDQVHIRMSAFTH
jgi:hypothetical protein